MQRESEAFVPWNPYRPSFLLSVAKRLPLQDEEFIFKLRIGYISAQVLSVAIYFFIMQKVCTIRTPEQWHNVD